MRIARSVSEMTLEDNHPDLDAVKEIVQHSVTDRIKMSKAVARISNRIVSMFGDLPTYWKVSLLLKLSIKIHHENAKYHA